MDQNKKSNGALIGSIIVIIILVVGGIYVFKMNIQKVKDTQKANEQINTANVLSSSDETADIEVDLNNNANMDVLDTNLQ
jgi:flagellar basal body-associated protein FliL